MNPPWHVEVSWIIAGALALTAPVQNPSDAGQFVYAAPASPVPERAITKHRAVALLPDGTELVADVYRPVGSDRHPVILVRTIYGRDAGAASYAAETWARRGYAFVVQDVRGKGESGGVFEPWVNEQADGFYSVEWAAQQPWSNGRVGMLGGSYLGAVQWAAASRRPPSLVTIAVFPAIADPFYGGPYDHGVFSLTPFWAYENGRREAREAPDFDEHDFTTLPLTHLDDRLLGEDVPAWNRYLELNDRTDWRAPRWPDDLCSSSIPALIFSALWDGDGIGPVLNWEARSECGKDQDRLIMGPWGHNMAQTGRRGDVEYGEASRLQVLRILENWFARHLQQGGPLEAPRAQIFVTGENGWRQYDQWPPSGAEPVRLHLTPPQSADGAGALGGNSPTETSQAILLYRPNLTGRAFADAAFARSTVMPASPVQGDQLVFLSPVFDAPTVLGGSPRLHLELRPDDQDADLFAFVVDVAPDGTMRVVSQPGKQRLSYRNHADHRQLLDEGRDIQANIRLLDFAHRFAAGHRLGLIVRSEWFPRWSRNPGAQPVASAETLKNADHQLLFGPDRSNFLDLSLLPGLDRGLPVDVDAGASRRSGPLGGTDPR